ncbi:NACHT domain-containing protein [Dactylosporangium sp. CA-233914]|uniref:NACHT domain-containing protein n=1 Tax=Dactylosporangium sp. CA-233914 TaxID=3239934 RepID=UPI003D9059FB
MTTSKPRRSAGPKPATEQPGNSFKYLYWRLSEKQFQQLCAALLRHKYDHVQCFPVGMADEGIDAISHGDIIYQVKWSSKVEQDPATWLADAIAGERKKIERLVKEKRISLYILMTSVAGTTTATGTGSVQKLKKDLEKYSKELKVPIECWWQADIDAEVDLAPDSIKWSYQEMLAGTQAMRYLIHGSQVEGDAAAMRETVLHVMASQWRDDSRIRFSQVDLDRISITDLFVDVRATLQAAPRNAQERFLSTQDYETQEASGAVEYLLKTTVPLTYLLGVPGQGKSTLSQYLTQVHRAAILPGDMLDSRKVDYESLTDPKLPIRIDLKDYALWLAGHDPFGDEEPQGRPKLRRRDERSLELFLAAFCSANSGGRRVTIEQVQSLLARYPTLLVLDGLDEVADLALRRIIVDQIDITATRMAASGNLRRFQILVTARPNASSLPEPDKDIFQTLRLEPLSPALQRAFMDKWCDVNDIHGAERRKLLRIFQSRTAVDHVGQLADNPMQLTILLFLISRKGEAVPVARTPLYTTYMETLLDREVNREQIEREQVPRVEEVTSFLGWYMQSGVELEPGAGRMILDDIKTILLIYFRRTQGPEHEIAALFNAVTDRFWALTSKEDGTFEFAVQPVREYFAARFLAEWAGQDRRDPLPKQDVLRQLIQRAYWLNTARFYAGFANPNELAGLRYGLEDALADRRHPLQERVAIWALLGDGIFANKLAVQRDVVRLLTDDLSLRLIADHSESSAFPRLGRRVGGDDMSAALMQSLKAAPDGALAETTVRILRRHLPLDRNEFVAWWTPQLKSALGTPHEIAWLKIGAYYGVPRLLPPDADTVTLDTPEACQAALAVGASPSPSSNRTATLLRAVLDGQCSDTTTSSTCEAGALLRAMRPQWFLQLQDGYRDGPRIPTEHLWLNDRDRSSRAAAWNWLVTNNGSYARLKRAANARAMGQKGTTEPWQNPARELARLHGPCWLAADIAIIGAAIRDTIASGSFDPSGQLLGDDIDYGSFVLALRRLPNADWWKATHDAYSDALSRRTWTLGLLATADEGIVIDNLDRIDAIMERTTDDDFLALAASSSRLGATPIPRRLGRRTFQSVAGCSPRTTLLTTHFASSLRSLDPLAPLSDSTLIELASPQAASWPIARAVTARLLERPNDVLLRGLAALGPQSQVNPQSEHVHPAVLEVLSAILAEPALYPGRWVEIAEWAQSTARKEDMLERVVLDQAWIPKVPRI